MRVGRIASTVLLACAVWGTAGCSITQPAEEPAVVVVAIPDHRVRQATWLADSAEQEADDEPPIRAQQQPAPTSSPPSRQPVTPGRTTPSSRSVKTAAKEAYLEAKRRFDGGDYAGALELYREADSLYPGAAPKYKEAVCLDKLRRWREAIRAYERFIRSQPSSRYDDSVADAHQRIAAIRARLP